MLDVGHHHKDPIARYELSAGEADKLPFKSGIVRSRLRVVQPASLRQSRRRCRRSAARAQTGGRFVVLDPVIEESKDAIDVALEAKINQVFRRTHGEGFRFHTVSSIERLLTKAGYRVPRRA